MNSARRPLIMGNWKMHHGGPSGLELAEAVSKHANALTNVDMVIAPPFTLLAACSAHLEGSRLGLAAQNLSSEKQGAFTGEISATMLFECGAQWTLIGHSERRSLYGETDQMIRTKTEQAIAAGIRPVVCVGESLTERESGRTLDVVLGQVRAVVDVLAAMGDDEQMAIAYEPVWAIGTGKSAGPAEAEEVHAAIRALLAQTSPALAERCRLLYGGSVKPETAPALFGCPNVDGALVGGASLDATAFGAIARAPSSLSNQAELS